MEVSVGPSNSDVIEVHSDEKSEDVIVSSMDEEWKSDDTEEVVAVCGSSLLLPVSVSAVLNSTEEYAVDNESSEDTSDGLVELG